MTEVSTGAYLWYVACGNYPGVVAAFGGMILDGEARVVCTRSQGRLQEAWAPTLLDFGAPQESVLTVTDSKVERTYHIFRTNAMDALVQILLR